MLNKVEKWLETKGKFILHLLNFGLMCLGVKGLIKAIGSVYGILVVKPEMMLDDKLLYLIAFQISWSFFLILIFVKDYWKGLNFNK